MRVYYFTGAQFALSNLALRRVKVARFADLNDALELLGVDRADKGSRATFRKAINEVVGLVCLSRSWKNPLLWSHYAEKHTGICMGFDIPVRSLVSVTYAKRLFKLDSDPITRRPRWSQEAKRRLLSTKSIDWKYEEEMRLLVPLDRAKEESGKYFYPFSSKLVLRNLILGSRCELPLDGIRDLVAPFEPPVVVIKSRIAFGRFEVLKDKSASRVDGKA